MESFNGIEEDGNLPSSDLGETGFDSQSPDARYVLLDWPTHGLYAPIGNGRPCALRTRNAVGSNPTWSTRGNRCPLSQDWGFDSLRVGTVLAVFNSC